MPRLARPTPADPVRRPAAPVLLALLALLSVLVAPLVTARPAAGAPLPVAGTYVPVAPSRVLDTRTGLGAVRATVPARGVVALTVLGHGGVPAAGVGAVVLNVTVTDATAPGYLTVYPTGLARPTASNLNVVPGHDVPNLVLVEVGAGGSITLFSDSTRPVDLVADVEGYVVAGTATRPGTITPTAPTRLLDTRTGVGTTRARVPARGEVSLQVSGRGGVPTGRVSAVVLNVTATGGDGDGYVTVYPNGVVRPTASNLNYVRGGSVANLVLAELGPDGRVNLYNGSAGGTDLVADLAGWVVDGTPTDAGALAALVPARILDTRTGGPSGPSAAVAPRSTRTLRVLGVGGVPSSGVAAVVLNVTVTQPTGPGFVTVYPGGTVRPNASSLNEARGQTVPNLVVAKVGDDGTVRLFNGGSGSVHLVADVAGYVRSTTVVPPAAVSGLHATTSATSVTLAWANPADASYTGVMVRRTLGPVPPVDATDGVLVADVAAPGASYVDQPLLPGHLYSYALFAHDTTPAYSAGATVTSATGSSLVPGAVAGTVRDAAGQHLALGGVVVTVASPTTGSSARVTTGSDGRYVATGLLPGSDYTVCLDGTDAVGGSLDLLGYAPWCHLGQSGATGTVFVTSATTSTVDEAMNAAGGLDGTVTDAAGGAPLAGAQVRVGPVGAVLPGAVAATTGSDGRYRLRGLAPGASLLVCFSAAGHGDQCYDGVPGPVGATPVLTVAGTSHHGVDAHLTTAASLGGVVRDVLGHGLGGAGVEVLQSGSVVSTATTRADGGYTVTGLAPGAYTVRYVGRDATGGSSDPTGYATSYLGGADAATATVLTLVAGQSLTGLDVQLTPAGSLSGTVLDVGGLTGLAGMRVTATSATHGSAPSVVTGADGTYVLKGLPVAGDYTLCVTVDAPPAGGTGYQPVCLGGGTLVVQGGVARTQDVTLTRGAAIHGLVTDAAGTHALANVLVTVTSGGLTLGTTHTGADGGYTLSGLAARTDYRVCFTPTLLTSGGTSLLGYQGECWRNQPTVLTATDVAVGAGGSTGGVDGTLAPLLGLP